MLILNPLSVILLLGLSVAQDAAAECYDPNGNPMPDGKRARPCNTTTPASMCCMISHRPDKFFQREDRCLLNGLCMNENVKDGDVYYRRGCTDRTWRSEYCLDFCKDGVDHEERDVRVFRCMDGGFCCGNKDCCFKLGTKLPDLPAKIKETSSMVMPVPETSKSSIVTGTSTESQSNLQSSTSTLTSTALTSTPPITQSPTLNPAASFSTSATTTTPTN